MNEFEFTVYLPQRRGPPLAVRFMFREVGNRWVYETIGGHHVDEERLHRYAGQIIEYCRGN